MKWLDYRSCPVIVDVIRQEFSLPKRLESFRVGDRREAITLSFLRYLGFVSPVPREEDVGLDAIVTLSELRDGLNYPTLTCGVQVKPRSYDAIYFGEEQFEYFHSLPFPMFLVTRDDHRIDFFSTTRLWYNSPGYRNTQPRWIWLRRSPASVNGVENWTLRDDDVELPKGKRFGLGKNDDPRFSIMLGDPIASVSETELEDSTEYRQQIGSILRAHLQIEIEGALLHQLGGGGYVSWATNELPKSTMGYPLGAPVENTPEAQRELIVAAVQYLDNSFSTEASKLDAKDPIPDHLNGMAAITQYLHTKGFNKIRENTRRTIESRTPRNDG